MSSSSPHKPHTPRSCKRTMPIMSSPPTPTPSPSSSSRLRMKEFQQLRILLPNGCHVSIEQEKSRAFSFDDVMGRVKILTSRMSNAAPINWGSHVQFEDALGNIVQEGDVFDSEEDTIALLLQDGQQDPQYGVQDFWNLTPITDLLDAVQQDYTLETALADLLDNSLQAVWENSRDQRRVVSLKLSKDKISIFDSGKGMDVSKRNSLAKWGTLGSSEHRKVRNLAVGGKPPFLTPFFGCYGVGALNAALHLGSVVVVSSKTKSSKKVVMLRLENEKLRQSCEKDRSWKAAGEFREPTKEEMEESPHGSFTKVELLNLRKGKVWKKQNLMYMLKDIYFPYIQCDDVDKSQRTMMPVEFEVNGKNLAEIEGGEVAIINMRSCNGAPFIIDIHLERSEIISSAISSGLVKHSKGKMVLVSDFCSENHSTKTANARIKCVYLPIRQGKETIDCILEDMEKMSISINENFMNFSRVSIRRLGRLLPNARWRSIPFMEPKNRRGERGKIPKICFQRVKAFIDTDSGFVPTMSKTELSNDDVFTGVLRNLGTREVFPDGKLSLNVITAPGVKVELLRMNKVVTLTALERDYEEWIMEMHDLFDEETDCQDGAPIAVITGQLLGSAGFSEEVFTVYTSMMRKGCVWKHDMKVKFTGLPKRITSRELYSTLEYFLVEGLHEDKGNAKVVCRPMGVSKSEGSKVNFREKDITFDLGKSLVLPIEVLSVDTCACIEGEEWSHIFENRLLQSPGSIEILSKSLMKSLDLYGGVEPNVKAGTSPFQELYVVVRSRAYMRHAKTEKDYSPLDQKNILKKPMHMKLIIKAPEGERLEACGKQLEREIMIPAMQKCIKGIHGFYCFQMNSCYLSFFTQAGIYNLQFSLRNDEKSDVVLEETLEINVLPSDTVAEYFLRWIDEPKMRAERPVIRLGQVLGPFNLHCFDEYGNSQNVNDGSQGLKAEVWNDKKKLEIQLLTLGLEQDPTRPYLTIKGILFIGGVLRDISEDHTAYLKFYIQNMCPISIDIIVLPGELHSVEEQNIQQVDDCLQKGDIIHTFELKAIDCWGNHVEKGCRVLLELDGLQLQDHGITDRMVNDEGYIRLGGLLKVTGDFNTEAEIRVRSHQGQLLYKRSFYLLRRHLMIISEVPKCRSVGAVIENVLVAIVDEEKKIINQMSGSCHLIAVKSCPETVYCVEEGCCCISIIQLPEEPGLWCCQIYDKLHPELEAQFEINLLPHEELLDILKVADNDLIVTSSGNFIPDLEDTGRIKQKPLRMVDRYKQELKSLNSRKEEDSFRFSKLKEKVAALEAKCRESKINEVRDNSDKDGTDFRSVAKEISHRGSVFKLLLRSAYEGTIPTSSVVGIVALLAYTEDKLLSKALADYIGESNMLAVVCETSEAASRLVRHNVSNGGIDETWGLFTMLKGKVDESNTKLRVYTMSEMGKCMYEHNAEDPQKRLKMVKPKIHGTVPEGFVDFAVNLLLFNKKHLELRSLLFYNLLGEAQVYKTIRHLVNARSALTSGGISLDGGVIRRGRGCEDFGKWENSKIYFPVNMPRELKTCSAVIRKIEVEEKLQKKRIKLESVATSSKGVENRILYLERKLDVLEKCHRP